MTYEQRLLQDALNFIRYDTSIAAGDARVAMRAAQAELRLGIRGKKTERAIYLARMFLGLAVTQ